MSRRATRTRHPFLPSEDEMIISYVCKTDKSWKGNAIYRELAAQMPNHSWQAVKGRFMKRLFFRLAETQQQELRQRKYNQDGTPSRGGEKRPRSLSMLPASKRRRLELDSSSTPGGSRMSVESDEEDDEFHHEEDDVEDLDDDDLQLQLQHLDDGEDEGDVLEPLRAADFANRKGGYLENAERWIEWLSEKTGRPRSVVTHALIVHSGIVERALRYLLNPDIYCRISARADQPWSVEEDNILLQADSSEEDIAALVNKRNKDSVRERTKFLDNKSLF